jgi:hypothetical protein
MYYIDIMKILCIGVNYYSFLNLKEISLSAFSSFLTLNIFFKVGQPIFHFLSFAVRRISYNAGNLIHAEFHLKFINFEVLSAYKITRRLVKLPNTISAARR